MLYDYRVTLRENFESRVNRNKSYSLRSFARDIEIPASRLSEILNNKRGTTVKNGLKIAKNLNLNKNETLKFILSIEAIHSRSNQRKEEAKLLLLKKSRELPSNYLNKEKFDVIASWYHYAILELLSLKESFTDSSSIAKRLGISKIQSSQALSRLEKLSLIKKTNKKYIPLTETSFTSEDIPSKALKLHHEENLKIILNALYEQKVEDREISSTTIAINKSKIPEVKRIIREFKKKISAIADGSSDKDSVYLLGTQLVRLDKN